MEVSPKGIMEYCELEGLVVAPYYDSVGVLTWGVGHTAAAGGIDPADLPLEMPANDAEMEGAIIAAIRQLEADAQHYSARVNDAVTVPVKQHEFDALFSFDCNTGGIYRAKLTRYLNAGDKEAAGNHFMGWLKPAEIRGRRKREMNLFKNGNYDSNGRDIPVWATDGQGNLTHVIKTVDGNYILGLMNRDKIKTRAPAKKSKPSRSKTLWGQAYNFLTANGLGLLAAFNQQDPIIKYAILGSMVLISVVCIVTFRDRILRIIDGEG